MNKYINGYIRMVITLLISSCILFGCSGSVENKQLITDKTTNIDTITQVIDSEKSIAENQSNIELKGEQVFKISNKTFFRSDSIMNLFTSKEQHKLGFVVPLDLSIGENSVYIPNRLSKTMLNYSKNGKFIGELKLPHFYSPDYFTLLPNNSLIINDFHLDSIVEIANGKIEYKAENSDLRFSAFGNNFLFRKNTSFFDKQGYFKGEYKFTYLYSTFDYMLIDESSFGLVYYDEESQKGIAEIIESGGLISKKNILGLPLDWDEYNGVKVLKINNKECLFLMMGGIGDLNSNKLIHYDFSTKEVKMINLVIDYEGAVFIGEGADLWSSGALYVYSEKENVLYSLFTGVEYIFLYKYIL